MDKTNRVIGQAICNLRTKRGLTQEALGDRAGVHRTYVSQLERGIKSPTLPVFLKLADALETRASSLLQAIEHELA